MVTSSRRDAPQPTAPATPWRLFAAVPVNDAVRRQLADVQGRLAARGWPVRWVDPALAHVTLQFYGDTPADVIPALSARLAEIAAASQPLPLQVAGGGVFPSPRRPRVLWLGLSGALADLDALARAVATTASMAPCADVKPFRPHITLGRVREGGAITDLESVIAGFAATPVVLSVERLQLIRSVLGRGGPAYTTLGEWQLGAPQPEVREHG